MKKYEYKILCSTTSQRDLTTLGKDGWRLMTVNPEGKYVMEREYFNAPEPQQNLTHQSLAHQMDLGTTLNR